MFAELIASGTNEVMAGLSCVASGVIPSKGDCLTVGWFPVVGRCRIGALKA